MDFYLRDKNWGKRRNPEIKKRKKRKFYVLYTFDFLNSIIYNAHIIYSLCIIYLIKGKYL